MNLIVKQKIHRIVYIAIMKLNISVIGAGVGGLASAIRMAVRGHEVTVYEQAPGPGGKMGELRWEGFRWDAGPSLFTLPELMEELYLIVQSEVVFIRVEEFHYVWHQPG